MSTILTDDGWAKAGVAQGSRVGSESITGAMRGMLAPALWQSRREMIMRAIDRQSR